MPLVPDAAAFQKKLAGLSVMEFQTGENVLTAGSSTGRLLVLRSGTVEVIKDGVQIAKVSTPGAVFGELAALLDQAHTADVRSLGQSEFYVANAATLLAYDPAVTLYVAAVLARRLDSANRALVEVRRQLRAGEPRSVIGKTVEKVEQLLSSSGDASLVYSGYPYDPLAPNQSPH
jgi:CRP/FNR family transcriptional regulator, cyclic AMP receptor protein